MNIIINNKEEYFEEEKLLLPELLKLKNFTFKMLVIKINGVLIKKSDWDTSEIKDGDVVIVLHLISGG